MRHVRNGRSTEESTTWRTHTMGTNGSTTGTNGSTTGNVHRRDPVSSTETDVKIVGDRDNTVSGTKGTRRWTHTNKWTETNSRKHDGHGRRGQNTEVVVGSA